MALLTGLALTLVSIAPQGDGTESLTILSATDQRSLNRKVQDWFDAWMERELAEDTATRRRVQPKYNKAREAFNRDWENKARKMRLGEANDLLKYVGDLQAMFDNAFPYSRQSSSGTIKRIKPRPVEPPEPTVTEYDIVSPRNYRDTNSYRTIVTIPGFVNGEWQDSKDYFEATWKGSKLAADSIFLLPDFEDAMDLDPRPDWTQPNALDSEVARNEALFMPLRHLQRSFRLNRSRVILDCGVESSAFGLRVGANFPSRFAGLILRDPVDVGNLRLESLTGLPVLLLRSNDPANQAACEKIAATLNGFEPGACTVLDTTGASPFTDSQADIDAWAENVQRDLFRKKVVLAPNNDLWNDGYWVQIVDAEPLDLVAPDERARIVVTADPATNRIEVEAIGVGTFKLLLNDALVNLDEEFTVIVNGQAMQQTKSRSRNTMAEGIFYSHDPTWIFTANFQTAVPKKPE